MKLEIRNIGRVEKADIEIQGITVVAGANGTGKSTISKSLYSILEMSNHPLQVAQSQKIRSLRNCIAKWKKDNIPIMGISTSELFKKVASINKGNRGNQDFFLNVMTEYIKESVPDKFWNEEKMQEEILQLFKAYNEIADRDLEYYCQYTSQMIVENVFQNQINCLKNSKEGIISCTGQRTDTKIEIQNQKITKLDMAYESVPGSMQPVYITTPDLMDSVGTYKKLFTAERYKTISYTNSQLTKLLLEDWNRIYFVAEEYNKIEEQKQQIQDLLKEVLEGEIYLDNNQIKYRDRWCNDNIELTNIASGMKIFLILQKLVNNGVFLERTCLIIDEPETNLHPEWQLKLAHLLVLLNKNFDISIYLNSHSPYFVRSIEYYADQHHILEKCDFYMMEKDTVTGMNQSECVTDRLGIIYDKMAEPFNRIM